ncbi:hypothetical protein AA313_de0205056 [Arthrobotrys entomopaga]|nr:hypothetical protein AA313_de0205056 [Arthrobotrys entomopaga]
MGWEIIVNDDNYPTSSCNNRGTRINRCMAAVWIFIPEFHNNVQVGVDYTLAGVKKGSDGSGYIRIALCRRARRAILYNRAFHHRACIGIANSLVNNLNGSILIWRKMSRLISQSVKGWCVRSELGDRGIPYAFDSFRDLLSDAVAEKIW